MTDATLIVRRPPELTTLDVVFDLARGPHVLVSAVSSGNEIVRAPDHDVSTDATSVIAFALDADARAGTVRIGDIRFRDVFGVEVDVHDVSASFDFTPPVVAMQPPPGDVPSNTFCTVRFEVDKIDTQPVTSDMFSAQHGTRLALVDHATLGLFATSPADRATVTLRAGEIEDAWGNTNAACDVHMRIVQRALSAGHATMTLGERREVWFRVPILDVSNADTRYVLHTYTASEDLVRDPARDRHGVDEAIFAFRLDDVATEGVASIVAIVADQYGNQTAPAGASLAYDVFGPQVAIEALPPTVAFGSTVEIAIATDGTAIVPLRPEDVSVLPRGLEYALHGTGQRYALTFDAIVQGHVRIDVPAGVLEDVNGNVNSSAATSTFVLSPPQEAQDEETGEHPVLTPLFISSAKFYRR